MKDNPWKHLPEKPPFVLPEDKEKVLRFNDEERGKANPNDLNLNLIPEPFVGWKKAPVVLLGNIAGVGREGDEREDDYKLKPAFTKRMRENLVYDPSGIPDPSEFPFFPLAPGKDIYPSHKDWWTDKLKSLLEEFGNGKRADSILARSILAIEFFTYRSNSNRYAHDRLKNLPSQEYNRFLVQEAMNREAVIVIRFGWNRWVEILPKLARYSHLVRLKGRQKTYISLKGCEGDGFQKIVHKIKETLR